MQNAQHYIDTDVKNVWHHLMVHKGAAPLIFVEADGMRLTDIHGVTYLDATSGGVWCVNVGYGRARIADAVAAQMKKMPYYAATAGNLPSIEFSRRLLGYMPGLSRVYVSNSGSEANEKAFKMIRQRAHAMDAPAKKKIIYRNRDYHGTTLAALSATGQPQRRDNYGPFVPGFVEMPHACCYRCAFRKTYPSCDVECATCLESIIEREGPETVGGVIFEPITAGGGLIPPVQEYYEIVSRICKKHDVLFIMDEVVCGMGRTGAMFGYQHYNVTPDVVTLAKGIASAYMPISCTVTTEDLFAAMQDNGPDNRGYFRDISTFGGCAAAATAALENLNIIEEEGLLRHVAEMGAYLIDRLREMLDHPHVGDVRGKGLFAGVELVEDKSSRAPLDENKVMAICGAMAADRVLAGRTNRSFDGGNNVIYFAPAYVATRADLDCIVTALQNALARHLP